MARKATGKVQASAAASAAADAQATADAREVDILFPEREIAIAGRMLTVREFGFREGLEVGAVAKPFIDALLERCSRGKAAPRFADIEDIAALHADHMVWMIAKAADVEPEWVNALSDEDGRRLMDVWWMANAGFFIRRLFRAVAMVQAEASPPAGSGSAPRSSAPDTAAPPPTSDGSHSDR